MFMKSNKDMSLYKHVTEDANQDAKKKKKCFDSTRSHYFNIIPLIQCIACIDI